MAFIDNTYFINEINVPSETLNNTYSSAIDRYEPEILQYLLGYELYNALDSDLDGNGDPQTQRFTDLVDGKEFSFSYYGRTINTKWEGLRNSKKISLISYYVYFNDRNENEDFYSNYGQVSSLGENSVKMNPVPKLSHVWYKMLELYGLTPNEIFTGKYNRIRSPYFVSDQINRSDIYYTPDEYFLDINSYDHYNILPSAYNFLLANKDSYPEWVFKPLAKINSFGI